MSKKADHDPVPPICAAIRRALDVHSESERAFAERTGISYSLVQKWARKQEPKLDGIRKLEEGLRPDAPAGWLLIAAGAVECPTTTEQAVRADIRLNEQGVANVLAALDAAAGFSGPRPRRS